MNIIIMLPLVFHRAITAEKTAWWEFFVIFFSALLAKIYHLNHYTYLKLLFCYLINLKMYTYVN